MTRLRVFWDYLRGTYWAIPSVMAVVATGLSVAMVHVDEIASTDFVDELSWAYQGGAEGARAVLSTIAASMITVAGVTFSITIVALTLASQQFGPRLLRNFLRDRGNQVVLGTFVSTFIYCLLVLRTVQGGDDSQFVPHLAVTTGVVLAMLSLGVLIYFIHHVATSIQASRVIANVAGDLAHAIDLLFPERIGHDTGAVAGRSTTLPADFDAKATVVCAVTSGYVQRIDSDALVELAQATDATVRLDARPGLFVCTGTPMFAAAGTDGGPETLDKFRGMFALGGERTGTQDVAFFINQLVELAVRALSPGINDPATARACIDRLEQALCLLAEREMPSAFRWDEEGALRVVAHPVTFAELTDIAFDEISRYSRGSVSVICRMFDAIRGVASYVVREEDRTSLARHAEGIVARARAEVGADVDRDAVEGCYRAARGALENWR